MRTALFTGSIAMLLCACKKDWTCQCITTDSRGMVMSTSVGKIHDTKSQAQHSCGTSSSLPGGSNSWSTVCKLQ